VTTVSSPAQLRTILRQYIEEALSEDAERRTSAPRGEPVYGPSSRIGDGRSATDVDLEILNLVLADIGERLAERDYRTIEVQVTQLLTANGLSEAHRNSLSYGVLEAQIQILEEIRRSVLGEAPVVLLPPSVESVPADAPGSASPQFSEVLPRYVDYAVKDKRWRGQSKA